MNTQERRRAHAAFELCYSLEQRRDLASYPTFIPLNIPLNAELVACRASNVGVFLSRSACTRAARLQFLAYRIESVRGGGGRAVRKIRQ